MKLKLTGWLLLQNCSQHTHPASPKTRKLESVSSLGSSPEFMCIFLPSTFTSLPASHLMAFPVPLSGSRDFCSLNPRPPLPCKEKKRLKHSHFLLLWCPCSSVVRSLLVSTMVRKVLPREWISGTLAGAGGEGNGNPAQCSCLENPTEPDMPQSMGSRRVRHDLEQQQHGAGGTKGLFYWSHLSCLKGQPESDMLRALQVLDEDKQVKALGPLCLPRPSTLSWPARPHPFPQPTEVSWLIFTFLCIT